MQMYFWQTFLIWLTQNLNAKAMQGFHFLMQLFLQAGLLKSRYIFSSRRFFFEADTFKPDLRDWSNEWNKCEELAIF